jgi:Tol biopolymer transport system component
MRKTIPPLPSSGGGGKLVPACLWALLLAGMLATCVLVGAWSEPAKGAFPGTNGRIAFEGYRVFDVSPEGNTSEAPEIITVRPDGTGMKQLTHASGSSDPDFSPDGTKIAYSGSPSIVEIYEDIYVMARSGNGKKALTDTDDRNEWGPAWSPDGTKIAFLREQPFTRPDGSNGSQPDIWVMNADGSGKRKITDDIAFENGLSWSPDGTKIAFEQDGDIWTIAPEGSGRRNLTDTPDAVEVNPDFSPDGQKLAFAGTFDHTDFEIYTMNLDGGALTTVTDNNVYEDEPAFSPSGTKIAYRKNVRIQNTRIFNAEIVTKSASGTGGVKNVSNDPGLDGSPDWGPRPTAGG